MARILTDFSAGGRGFKPMSCITDTMSLSSLALGISRTRQIVACSVSGLSGILGNGGATAYSYSIKQPRWGEGYKLVTVRTDGDFIVLLHWNTRALAL